ncbi:putative F-box domain-containing protein [Helianthus annuus]|nr:putative F-box domain-containing protein [Helianthus annuus]
MAEVVNEDVVEQILIELDVKDLIRFKTVCKSWHSLITSPRFVNRHLIRSHNKDRNNKEIGHRRIGFVNAHPDRQAWSYARMSVHIWQRRVVDENVQWETVVGTSAK